MNVALMNAITKKAVPTLTRRINRKKLVLKKQSPHIFFVAGIAGTLTSTVLACRATLKLPDTLGEIENDVANMKEVRASYAELGPEERKNELYQDMNKDTAYVYIKAGLKLGQLYAPAIGVGAISIAALTGAHVQLSRRNTALMAAYAAVSKAYDDYRQRVMHELGEERELDIYHAAVKSVSSADGESINVADPNAWSPYARFFDETSQNWERNPEFNRLFIQAQQNYFNEMLRARGHLFLNEVYDELGFERTQAGTVVGWLIGNGGDDFVDFGMYEAVNNRFINGLERTPLLDFNVDGVIYDKI